MATVAAVTNMPALALLSEDGRLERGTDPFSRWYEDNEEICRCSPEVQRVLDGQADAAILKLDKVAVDIVAMTDRDGRRRVLLTLPTSALPSLGDAGDALLDVALDESRALVWLKDLDGRYVRANARFTAFLSTSEERLLGRTDAELPAAETVDGPRNHERDADVEEPLHLEYFVGPFQGREALAVLRFPVSDRHGVPMLVCGVAAPSSEAHVARSEAARLLRVERWSRLDADSVRAELLAEWGLLPDARGRIAAPAPAACGPGIGSAEAEAAVAEARAERAAAVAERDAALSANEKLAGDLAAAQARLPELERTLELVRQRFGDDAEGARAEVLRARADADAARSEVQRARADADAARSEVQRARADAEAARAAAATEHEAAVADAVAERKRVRAAGLEEAQASAKELERGRNRIDEVEAQLEHGRTRIVELERERAAAEARVTELEDHVTVAQARIEELEDELDEARAQAKDAVAAEASVEIGAAEHAAAGEPAAPAGPAMPTGTAVAPTSVAADVARLEAPAEPGPRQAGGVSWQPTARRALSASLARESVWRNVLKETAEVLGSEGGWDAVTAWLPGEANHLACAATWMAHRGLDQFETVTCDVTLVRDGSLLDQALQAPHLTWLTDLDSVDDERLQTAAAHGMNSALLLPVRTGNAAIGLLELLTHDTIEPDAQIALSLEASALQLGRFGHLLSLGK